MLELNSDIFNDDTRISGDSRVCYFITIFLLFYFGFICLGFCYMFLALTLVDDDYIEEEESFSNESQNFIEGEFLFEYDESKDSRLINIDITWSEFLGLDYIFEDFADYLELKEDLPLLSSFNSINSDFFFLLNSKLNFLTIKCVTYNLSATAINLNQTPLKKFEKLNFNIPSNKILVVKYKEYSKYYELINKLYDHKLNIDSYKEKIFILKYVNNLLISNNVRELLYQEEVRRNIIINKLITKGLFLESFFDFDLAFYNKFLKICYMEYDLLEFNNFLSIIKKK